MEKLIDISYSSLPLRIGTEITFTFKNYGKIKGIVQYHKHYYIDFSDSKVQNSCIFTLLELDSGTFINSILGYYIPGQWPLTKSLEDLQELLDALLLGLKIGDKVIPTNEWYECSDYYRHGKYKNFITKVMKELVNKYPSLTISNIYINLDSIAFKECPGRILLFPINCFRKKDTITNVKPINNKQNAIKLQNTAALIRTGSIPKGNQISYCENKATVSVGPLSYSGISCK